MEPGQINGDTTIMKKISKLPAIILVFTWAIVFIIFGALGSTTNYITNSELNIPSHGCTNILVGKKATLDGSTIGTFSGDGAPCAAIKVEPRHKYSPGTMMPIYRRPKARNYEQYVQYLEKRELLGKVPQVEETFRYIDLGVFDLVLTVRPWHCGCMNEYGLTLGDSTIGGNPQLYNPKGILMTLSYEPQRSLMVIALQRAKTAREAIRVMGSLAEEYGFYDEYFHGDHVMITDCNETWSFEIFGSGSDWEPGSGKPGAVWCAQRIPDGHVGVCANRSRIGEIDLDNPDYFMASPNVFSLAIEKGWWNQESGEPFIWYKIYGSDCGKFCRLREWTVLNRVAPSLNLNPETTRFPFSVKPDKLLSVQDIMSIHRDAFEGTPYDITQDPVFYVNGKKNPMACPWGPQDLHKLIGVNSTRSVASPSSSFTFVSQVRADLPDPIKGCMWLGFGPAATTCYLPIYSGATKLPESWGDTEPTRINREDSWWAFNLVDNLSLIRYQEVIKDIEGVRNPAEAAFLAQQADFENAVVAIYSQLRRNSAETIATKLVTQYSNSSMNAVSKGYWELVDFLLYKYYFRHGFRAPQNLPNIDLPVPTVGHHQSGGM